MDRQEPSQLNALQAYRPQCSKCGSLTVLTSIEPSAEVGHDLRKFQCENCGTSEAVMIRHKSPGNR